MEKQERSSFSSRVGFVLAASGSAVGLGNLWRFPYLAARYGGGIFLLVYLILVVTFGFSLMITEFAIGRKTKLSCIGAYGALDKRFNFLGWIAAFVPLIITPYYCVIGGWVMKYLWTFVSAVRSRRGQRRLFQPLHQLRRRFAPSDHTELQRPDPVVRAFCTHHRSCRHLRRAEGYRERKPTHDAGARRSDLSSSRSIR